MGDNNNNFQRPYQQILIQLGPTLETYLTFTDNGLTEQLYSDHIIDENLADILLSPLQDQSYKFVRLYGLLIWSVDGIITKFFIALYKYLHPTNPIIHQLHNYVEFHNNGDEDIIECEIHANANFPIVQYNEHHNVSYHGENQRNYLDAHRGSIQRWVKLDPAFVVQLLQYNIIRFQDWDVLLELYKPHTEQHNYLWENILSRASDQQLHAFLYLLFNQPDDIKIAIGLI